MAVSYIRQLMTHTYDSSFSGRKVEGMLRGFDPFMNLVLSEAIEFTKQGTQNAIGMIVVRGNSVVMLEAKDRI